MIAVRVFASVPYPVSACRRVIITRDLTFFAVFSIWLLNVSVLFKIIPRYFGLKL